MTEVQARFIARTWKYPINPVKTVVTEGRPDDQHSYVRLLLAYRATGHFEPDCSDRKHVSRA